ncbi:Cloroperoxidase [Gymnopus androsaceus JB14]|uniref:Cloroperoxidase n=1 Tax=Gymnopus androsaceus JB14 TaxID=1447944 RepID=A0A6A4H0U4_9AGAR|nr:Cloroperoxidase [Gymnopus androsaceus JB14]
MALNMLAQAARGMPNNSSLGDLYVKAHPSADKRTTTIPFDPDAQYVSTTGDVPPGPGNLRGPCPGLNALANHNYLPRNGIATIAQFIEATYKVYGMRKDLSTRLAVFGVVNNGNLLTETFSIGGTPPPGIGSIIPITRVTRRSREYICTTPGATVTTTISDSPNSRNSTT